MKKVILFIQIGIILYLLQGCGLFSNNISNAPIIVGDEIITLEENQTYPDWKSFITISDEEDGTILVTDEMIDATDVNLSQAGTYYVIYTVEDSDGNASMFTLQVDVIMPEYQYAQGSYDLSHLDGSSKAIIYNAMENYLLEHMIGGVPLYRLTEFYMYSDRVDLFSDTYNAVYGFGHDFSRLLEDDSHVLMDALNNGEQNEFTFRSTYVYDMESDMWNPYESEMYHGISDYIHGSLYTYEIDESLSGFNYKEELAKTLPIAVNSLTIDGETYANTWQIPVKDDLVWSFHPDTNTSLLPNQYQELDASDFLWTWQIAIKNDWFRAISGGNDFISSGILNAQDYDMGLLTDINQVGLRLALDKDNTLEIEFEEAKTYDEVIYMFAQKDKSPLNKELYDYVIDHTSSPFGTTPQTIASSGPYILDEIDSNQTVKLIKNENYVYEASYHYTGLQLRLMDEDEAFLAFLNDELDMAHVPRTLASDYLDDHRMKGVETYTTFRLLINGFSSNEERDDYFNFDELPQNYRNWELEPILQYKEMKQALYYSIDRLQFSNIYSPAYTYFPNHYILDVDGTSIYEGSTGEDLLNLYNQNSFDVEKAQQFFHEAIEKSILDGYYAEGIQNASEENPFYINIELTYSEVEILHYNELIASLASQLETNLFDDQLHVGVDIILNPVSFPSVYYDYINIAQTDLAIGGLSGMSIPQDLNQFRDDYKMYPLNFGIDTSSANIEIKYMNLEGNYVYEIWSFNAMCEALMGEVEVTEGLLGDNN
ncbi:hypothetical protein BK010_00130 [Tenericutes bacterium MO-XQ]|nr:hypothetical protein BK010_00130 [Tenericutes bacterium MO-XQ]